MLYELRIYNVLPGKMDVVKNFFKNTNIKYFRKYHFDVEGMWQPIDDQYNWYYLLKFKDKKDMDEKWNAFHGDPGWYSEMLAADMTQAMNEQGVHSYLMEQAPFFAK